jgi:hypothetical protein
MCHGLRLPCVGASVFSHPSRSMDRLRQWTDVGSSGCSLSMIIERLHLCDSYMFIVIAGWIVDKDKGTPESDPHSTTCLYPG